jgi:hypothetical protein
MFFGKCKSYLTGINPKGVSTVIAAILTHIVRYD